MYPEEKREFFIGGGGTINLIFCTGIIRMKRISYENYSEYLY